MHTDSRLAYLNELGLTLWRQRSGDVVSAVPVDEPVVGRPRSFATQEHEVSETDAQVSAQQPAPPMVQADDDLARMDWDALETYLAGMDHRGASRPVFGVGAKDAPLLIVGEAPGAEEDKLGEPFVGRAGKLLDRMLFAIGHDRQSNTYIANICKFRPPGNRDPNPEEVAADRPILERQIQLLKPRLVVAVGRVAAQTLLGSTENLGKLRGRLHSYPGMDIPLLVTYHQAYLLRSPQQKSKAWEDLKQIATRLEAGG